MMRAPQLVVAFSFLALSLPLAAQGTGPDVIVGDLHESGPRFYGVANGTAAYAIATTSCNVGDQNLSWISSTNQHPVIGQNIYRLRDGRMEMVGMSHLKHGFTALTQSLCSPCSGVGGSRLGVGCSDPYSSSLNGSQGNLGPRFEVNAATGYFPYPYSNVSGPSNILNRRLQVATGDLDPANPLNAGARYFGEGQYIAADDTAAGNGNNNVSYREIRVNSDLSMNWIGSTQRTKPAIEAWADIDPAVTLQTIDIPNDGRMILAHRSYDEGGGLTRHEYALYNMNSDRCAEGLVFFFPAGANVSNLYFHDVDHHSGSPINGLDWNVALEGNVLSFRCRETFAQNQWANALRWGTTFNFSFVTDQAPTGTRIDLFKPGTPTAIEMGNVFKMDLFTTGMGTNNLSITLSNIPEGTTEGYGFFSLTTPGGAGGGNLLGVYADQLTILGLTTPSYGDNPFHWPWPVSGVYPATPFSLPPGFLQIPPATQADGMAIALDPNGTIIDYTPVSRTTF